MTRSTLNIFALLAAVTLAAADARPARASVVPPPTPPGSGRMEAAPPELKDITVEERLKNSLPLDATFLDERGQTVTLRQYFDNARKPVVLQLGYFGCPMLCDLVSQGLSKSLKELSLDAGSDFDVIFLSFDATETPGLASKKKAAFLRDYGRPESAGGWHFLTGKQRDIDAVTTAVGYKYKWVESIRQFSHPAAVVIATPDGRVSRYLYPHGMKFDEPTLRLSLVEASDGKIGSTVDRFMLTCFHYDGKQGKYALAAMSLMRIGGVLTVIVVAAVLVGLFRREAAARRRAAATAEARP